MGIAITSGVLASLDSQSSLHVLGSGNPKWESHTPGTSTPTNVTESDPTLPSRFIACVKREESAKRLREKFRSLVGGEAIEIIIGQNVAAVQRSDVVLLWCVRKDILILIGVLRDVKMPLFLSCKPQVAHLILNEDGIKEALAGKLLISILAGVTIAQLSNWVLPTTTVIRAMPNTACRVRLSRLFFFCKDISICEDTD